MLVGDHAYAWAQRVVSRREFPDQIAGPAQGAIRSEHNLIVGSLRNLGRTRFDLACQRLLRSGIERLCLGAGGGRVRRKHKSVQAADHVALDRDFT